VIKVLRKIFLPKKKQKRYRKLKKKRKITDALPQLRTRKVHPLEKNAGFQEKGSPFPLLLSSSCLFHFLLCWLFYQDF